MVSLEKILAYVALKPFLSKADWKELGAKLGINEENLRRAWGKDVEDRFFLMALTCEVVEHIVVFHEGFAKLSQTPSPDGLLILRDGRRILVEVKASSESKWSITKGRLERQKNFAQKMGAELYYAINLRGYWGFFSAEYVEGNGCKIEYPGDLKHCAYNEVFKSQMIKIPKGLKIVKYYSPDEEANALVPHNIPGFGFLYKYELMYGDKVWNLSAEDHLLFIAAIESKFYDEPVVEKISDKIQRVVQTCTDDLVCFEYDLVLEPIYLTISSVNEGFYDSSTFITNALDKLQNGGKIQLLAFKKAAFSFLGTLREQGLPFQILDSIDDITYTGF